MSVVYSIIFIYFLSAFGETIAWICVVILQLAFIALAGLGWYGWDQSKKAGEQLGESYPDGIPDEVIKKNTKETNMALGLMILGGILASTFFCAVCCGYSSLKTAIDCIDAAADFLA
jgi:TRAP-type C4-dicarboxylate transport system permease small subunit